MIPLCRQSRVVLARAAADTSSARLRSLLFTVEKKKKRCTLQLSAILYITDAILILGKED